MADGSRQVEVFYEEYNTWRLATVLGTERANGDNDADDDIVNDDDDDGLTNDKAFQLNVGQLLANLTVLAK